MVPQNCIVGMPTGDCWRACVATITGERAETMPNFMHLDGRTEPFADEGLAATRDWLAERGFGLFETYCSASWTLDRLLETFSKPNPNVPIIITGCSVADPTDGHAVVALNGEIVHDPSGAGLSGPYPCQKPGCDCGMTWWWLYTITVNDKRGL